MIKVVPVRTSEAGLINYCYLVYHSNSNSALIVDPGWEFDLIFSKISNLNLTIKGVLLTHYHLDHSNLADRFARIFNCNVYISNIESTFYKFNCHNLNKVTTENPFLIDDFVVHPIKTPGHTLGSMCFQIDKYLFSGDTLFAEGCGHCIDKGSSAEDLFRSMQKLKRRIEADVIVFPGHSFGVNVGQHFEHLNKINIYLQLNSIDVFVKFRTRKCQSMNYKYT